MDAGIYSVGEAANMVVYNELNGFKKGYKKETLAAGLTGEK